MQPNCRIKNRILMVRGFVMTEFDDDPQDASQSLQVATKIGISASSITARDLLWRDRSRCGLAKSGRPATPARKLRTRLLADGAACFPAVLFRENAWCECGGAHDTTLPFGVKRSHPINRDGKITQRNKNTILYEHLKRCSAGEFGCRVFFHRNPDPASVEEEASPSWPGLCSAISAEQNASGACVHKLK